MTPKEEAKEIYFSMLNEGKGMISEYLAKQCAFICVDKLISISENNYFKKVKTELKKL